MSKEGMTTQALAGEIAAAVLADENDGGCDISAGLFGPAFSAIIRKIATEYVQPAAAPEAVAYLDIGAGGYLDLGSNLPEVQLLALPKGRHALGIIGTYGIDGYASAPVATAPVVDGRDVRAAIAGIEGSVAVGSDGEWVSVRRTARDAAVTALRNLSSDCAHIYAAYAEAKASIPAAPVIDFEQFRDLIGFAAWHAINLPEADARRDFIQQATELLALIDASPKGGTCGTCNGHGMIGGLLPAGGGYESEPCPDCSPKGGSTSDCPIIRLAPGEYTDWEKRVWRRGVIECATQPDIAASVPATSHGAGEN